MKIIRNYALATRLACGLAVVSTLVIMPPLANAQDETTTTGTVVSSSRNTLTLRNASGQYQLFILRIGAGRRSATLAPGTRVRVTSTAGDDPGIRVATAISAGNDSDANQNAAGDSVVPPEIRRVERDIERQAKRLQVGVRAGVALDPELILLGVQAQVGPFFSSNVFFRPNVEFGFGEVTALFALNPEFIYRLPGSSGNRTSYVGVGPGFNFLHQNFTHTSGSGSRIDFGDFHSDVGLNILGGIRYRSGVFTELKASVYSDPSPTLRLIVGYTF